MFGYFVHCTLKYIEERINSPKCIIMLIAKLSTFYVNLIEAYYSLL